MPYTRSARKKSAPSPALPTGGGRPPSAPPRAAARRRESPARERPTRKSDAPLRDPRRRRRTPRPASGNPPPGPRASIQERHGRPRGPVSATTRPRASSAISRQGAAARPPRRRGENVRRPAPPRTRRRRDSAGTRPPGSWRRSRPGHSAAERHPAAGHARRRFASRALVLERARRRVRRERVRRGRLVPGGSRGAARPGGGLEAYRHGSSSPSASRASRASPTSASSSRSVERSSSDASPALVTNSLAAVVRVGPRARSSSCARRNTRPSAGRRDDRGDFSVGPRGDALERGADARLRRELVRGGGGVKAPRVRPRRAPRPRGRAPPPHVATAGAPREGSAGTARHFRSEGGPGSASVPPRAASRPPGIARRGRRRASPPASSGGARNPRASRAARGATRGSTGAGRRRRGRRWRARARTHSASPSPPSSLARAKTLRPANGARMGSGRSLSRSLRGDPSRGSADGSWPSAGACLGPAWTTATGTGLPAPHTAMHAEAPWNPRAPSPTRETRAAETATTPPSEPAAARRAMGHTPPSGHAMGRSRTRASRPVSRSRTATRAGPGR